MPQLLNGNEVVTPSESDMALAKVSANGSRPTWAMRAGSAWS